MCSFKVFCRKTLWALVLTVGVVGCMFEVQQFLKVYFEYRVVITLQTDKEWNMEFPAVTICNLNRLRVNELHENCNKCSLNYLQCLDLGDERKETHGYRKQTERSKYVTCSKFSQGGYTGPNEEMLRFLNTYRELSKDVRRNMGHQGETFVRFCSYNGLHCDLRNFTLFQSLQYGNCYTFNQRNCLDNETLKIQSTGPNSGLELIIDLEPQEYVKFSGEVGARVVVHDCKTNLNPEDEGIDVSPGHMTSVAIQKTSVHRLPSPYKDHCREYDIRDNTTSQESCFRHCILELSLARCGCTDPTLPEDTGFNHCDLTDKEKVCCLDEIMEIVSESDTVCDCSLPCTSVEYGMKVSHSLWPSKRNFDTLPFVVRSKMPWSPVPGNTAESKKENNSSIYYLPPTGNGTTDGRLPSLSVYDESKSDVISTSEIQNQMTKISSSTADSPPEREMDIKEARERMIKLKIFFDTLDHTQYRQEPMYQDSELFSQLGGQMGLWLGLSLVTLFKLGDTFMTSLHREFLRKRTRAKRTKNEDSPERKKQNFKIFAAQ